MREKIINQFESYPIIHKILSIILLFRIRKRIIEFFPINTRIRNFLTILLSNKFPVFLEYEVIAKTRYQETNGVHPELNSIIGQNRTRYEMILTSFLKYADNFQQISKVTSEITTEPIWRQYMLPPLDAVAIYSFLAEKKPKICIEVGSGNSTMFARRSIKDNNLDTKIISIDPCPRRDIDSICDISIRSSLSDIKLDLFEQLKSGDMLLIDNSHYTFMSSDVTVFFMEILPRLAKGVIVQIHDIFLPRDYPSNWGTRWYAEQYLLATLLIANNNKLKILLPNNFIHHENDLRTIVEPLWKHLELSRNEVNGLEDGTGPAGFWFETT
jgi:hypothetical protein